MPGSIFILRENQIFYVFHRCPDRQKLLNKYVYLGRQPYYYLKTIKTNVTVSKDNMQEVSTKRIQLRTITVYKILIMMQNLIYFVNVARNISCSVNDKRISLSKI